MLWALLIALLIAKLSGGPEEIFMIPKLDKEIKTYVTDNVRKQQILSITKDAKKEIKAFQKIRKSKLKEISKLAQDQNKTSDDLLDIYQVYYDARLNMQKQLIENRLDVQQFLTDAEWKQLIENAVLPSDKIRRKADKADAKEEGKVDKLVEEIDKAINKEVKDSEKREAILLSLETFTISLEEFIDEGQQMNFKDNKIIRDKNATREDLEKFYDSENELRMKGTKDYFKIRESAIQNSTDDEWKRIVKALNKISKS